MADGDGLDAPATVNGRLLVGRQGTLSAWARHTLQARLPAGLLHQAPRGEGALPLPTGLVRHGQGQGHKMPTQEAHARWALVCETFLPGRSARKVVEECTRHALLLPRRERLGALVWKAPRGASVLASLQPPASAGACTYGRPRTGRREASQRRPSRTRLPQDQWRLCLPPGYPSDIPGETDTPSQALRKDHHAADERNTTRGMPRPGNALWHGLVYGGEGGHTRVVPSKGGTRSLWKYLRQPYRTSVGQSMAAAPVDPRGGDAFCQALAPGERDG
jgi:hypothetical protein